MNPADPLPRSRAIPGWLVLLGALMALGPLSIDMYLPSFPAIAAGLHTDAGSVQLTLATFFTGLALGQAVYGPLSDRFGRKAPLYVGLGLYIVASLACALAPDIAQLAAWRFVQAIGGCAGMVISRAIVRDRCSPQEMARAFSLLMLVMGLAPILAPLIGGWLISWFHWRLIFVVLALFAVCSLLAMHFLLEETLDTRQAQPLELGRVLGSYAQLLRDRHFMAYTLTGGLISAGMFAYISGSPFVLIELYGIAPAHYGWVFGANALGLVAAGQINARLLRRHSLDRILGKSLYLPLLGAGLLVLATLFGKPPLAFILIGLFLFVASIGLISPNSGASALQYQGRQAGTASALMGALQFGLGTLAGVAMSLWHAHSAQPLALVMALCALGALILYRALALPLLAAAGSEAP